MIGGPGLVWIVMWTRGLSRGNNKEMFAWGLISGVSSGDYGWPTEDGHLMGDCTAGHEREGLKDAAQFVGFHCLLEGTTQRERGQVNRGQNA